MPFASLEFLLSVLFFLFHAVRLRPVSLSLPRTSQLTSTPRAVPLPAATRPPRAGPGRPAPARGPSARPADNAESKGRPAPGHRQLHDAPALLPRPAGPADGRVRAGLGRRPQPHHAVVGHAWPAVVARLGPTRNIRFRAHSRRARVGQRNAAASSAAQRPSPTLVRTAPARSRARRPAPSASRRRERTALSPAVDAQVRQRPLRPIRDARRAHGTDSDARRALWALCQPTTPERSSTRPAPTVVVKQPPQPPFAHDAYDIDAGRPEPVGHASARGTACVCPRRAPRARRRRPDERPRSRSVSLGRAAFCASGPAHTRPTAGSACGTRVQVRPLRTLPESPDGHLETPC